ncbi:type II toxin-antitoxin system Phd/YefM family antitoxin [Ornithinimicrobium cerasi]|uniref:type II toxin-antitoxin system Phd/YefM family antitoxin n=1 Tax=Ornithinimicrobium cerasi TaxID=2248773 RepID=UPI000EFF9C69|nr:type II toxin-antitoxin system prevent-host-death family antitoxin [Ornithinimicrobium cerasi]
METVGLRELRQDASGLLRRVERGEEIIITVSGRPSARLVPARQTRWQRWGDVTDLFAGPADADWEADREMVDDAVRDAWAEW